MNWAAVAIGEVAQVFDGPHATPKPSDHGPIFLGIKNIRPDGLLDFSDIRHVSPEEFPRWTKRVTPTYGDVVFTYEATLHRYALIPEGFVGCLGRRTALVRPDPARVDSRFLYFQFRAPQWWAKMEQEKLVGSTVDRIPVGKFPDFEIRLPEISVQRRIADILSAYDDLIENNNRRMALLEESIHLLYREWFVYLRFPGHERVQVVEGVPAGWRETTIGAVCEVFDGPHKTPPPADEGPVYLGIKNITPSGRLDLSTIRHISNQDFPRWTKRVVPRAGDVVFTYEATLHRYAVIPPRFNGCLGRRMGLLRPRSSEVDARFLYPMLRSRQWRHYMESQKLHGATVDRISIKKYPDFKLLLPPRAVLDEFVSMSDRVLQQRAALRAQNRKLREARDLLLPRLMDGRIPV